MAVVAAASVVARAEFVRQMHALSQQFGEKLQKGAGPLVKAQAASIIRKFGARALGDFAHRSRLVARLPYDESGSLQQSGDAAFAPMLARDAPLRRYQM